MKGTTMRSLRVWRFATLFAVVALVALLAQVVLAQGESDNPQGAGGAIAAIVTHTGGVTTQTRKVGSPDIFTTTSTSYVTLTATSLSLAGTSLLQATFSGESACYHSTTAADGSDWCTLRIMVCGPAGCTEMNPVAGNNFAFDSTDGGRETFASWESHSISRFSNCLGAGTYRVLVQVAVVDNAPVAPPTFWLDDWTLSVERMNGCT